VSNVYNVSISVSVGMLCDKRRNGSLTVNLVKVDERVKCLCVVSVNVSVSIGVSVSENESNIVNCELFEVSIC
jgi:hypothetical protein